MCRDNPDHVLSENIRNVMTGVLYPPDGKQAKSVVVTGASKGDGKTTLAVGVATCIANLGKKVMLIDANFRKPDIAKLFGLGNIPGLGDLLVYGDKPEEVAHYADTCDLTVLTAGTPPAQQSMVGSRKMQDLLDKFKQEYDYIIVDAPPLLLPEARILAPMADGVVCSFRAKSRDSRRSTVNQALGTLRRLGARTIGVALNGVNPRYDGFGKTQQTLNAYKADSKK
jgi:capsular exopolysaccharide synthesis family protein